MQKKIINRILSFCFLLFSLTNMYAQPTPTVIVSDDWQCGSNDALKYNMTLDANVAVRSAQYESALQYKSTSSIVTPTPYVIPVVFHIIKDPNIATPIPTYQQILWQLASLNAAFSNSLTSLNGVPGGAHAVNTQIKFCLAKQMQTSSGPVAWPTSSVGVMNYVSTNTLITSNIVITNTTSIATLATLTNYTLNFPPNMYLNIWCVPNITQNSTYSILDSPSIIGVGTFPWMTWPIDGIVMRNDCIGNSTYINFGMFQPLDKGNILAHEVGHYLGLFHTFETITGSNIATAGSTVVSCYGQTAGTANSEGDLIYDTPPTKINGNVGPGPLNTCNETYAPFGTLPDENDLLEDFMSYSDDDLMNTFTQKQSERAYGALDALWSTIALTAQRFNLITNANLIATGVNNIPSCGPGLLTSVFTSSIIGSSITCSTSAVQFNTPILPNYLSATSYTWNFGDATSSNLANPIHTYTIPPTSFTVTLSVSNGTTVSTTTNVVNVPNGTPKIVGQSGNGFKVCRGTEQTILIQFPAYSTNATITDGTNFYTVNNNNFHQTNTPNGVYTYPHTFTVTSNVSFSMVPANCSTVSSGVATFSVVDCCSNLVSNGDMEAGPTGFYTQYPSITSNNNPNINYPPFGAVPAMSNIIGGTGKAFTCDSYAPLTCPGSSGSWINLGQGITGLKPSTQYYISVKTNQSEDSIWYCGPTKYRIKFYNSSSTLLSKNFVPSTFPYSPDIYGGSHNSSVHVFNYTVVTSPTITAATSFSIELLQVDRSAGLAFDFLIDNILVQEMNPPITITPTLVTICPNSTVQLIAANGCANIGSYSLVWQPQASLSCSTCPNPIASPSVTTVYTLVAIPPIATPPQPNIVLTTTVVVPTFTASAITPTPLCYGSSYTLNAIGVPTATWQPSGLIGASVVITPTASGTYTASYNTGTCVVTKTVNVSGVVGDPASITITSTLNPICYTGSVNTITTCLTAVGSNFTWTPGSLTGNTLCITPTVTTNYTVTGLTTNSCAASGSIQMVVLSMPATPTIVASSPYGCPTSNLTLTAIPSSPYGYTWTPGSFTGNPAVFTPTANQIYLVTTNSLGCGATASISIPYINAPCSCISGCTSTLSGNVNTSPATNTVYCVTANLSVNGVVTFSNSDFRIYPGVSIVVNNNAVLNIVGSHLYSCDNMWQGITVLQGGRLYISSSAARTSLVEDAYVAVDFSATASGFTTTNVFTADNATFNRNQISIRLNKFDGNQTSYPYTISNCLFTSRTITFSALSHPATNTIKNGWSGNSSPLQTPYINDADYPALGMKAPLAGAFPSTGIVLDQNGYTTIPLGATFKGISIGTTGANNFNCFDNLREDINAHNSNFTVINSVFQNAQRYGKGLTSGGKAIVAVSDNGNSSAYNNNEIKLLSATNNTLNTNLFYDKVSCADVTGYLGAVIQYARVYSYANNYNLYNTLGVTGNRAFNINTNRYYYTTVQYNEIYNIKNAILIGLDNGYFNVGPNSGTGRIVGTMDITYNKISKHPVAPVSNEYVNIGVSISDPFSASSTTTSPFGCYSSVNNNTFTSVHNGVSASNIGFAVVHVNNNSITMVNEPSTFFTPVQNGVLTTQLVNSNITLNNISGPASYTNEISAVKTSMNSQLTVKCNTTANTYHGLNFNASQAITSVQDNIMQSQKYGISMTNTATIGTQGTSTIPTNNQWLGSWAGTNKKTMNYNQYSTAQNSKIYATWGGALDPNGSSTVVALPGSMATDDYFHNAIGPNTILNASSISPSCRLGGGGEGGSGFAAMSSPAPASNTISLTQRSLLENLVNNTTTNVANEVRYIDKNRVYRTLDANTTFTTGSAVLGTFYTNALSSCMHKFVAVEKDLYNGNIVAAQSKLSTITATNTVENNYKSFYNLYIKLKSAIFNSADSSVLLNLCSQCPYTDGGVVYQARALYNIMNNGYSNFNDNCSLSIGSRLFDDIVKDDTDVNVLIKTKLYPNPNNGEFTIEINKKTEGNIEEITIYDLTGKLLNSITENGTSIKVTTRLLKGSYFIKVRLSNKSVDVHRIIID